MHICWTVAGAPYIATTILMMKSYQHEGSDWMKVHAPTLLVTSRALCRDQRLPRWVAQGKIRALTDPQGTLPIWHPPTFRI